MADNSNNFHIPQHVIKHETIQSSSSSPPQPQYQIYYPHQVQVAGLPAQMQPRVPFRVSEPANEASVAGLDYSTNHHQQQGQQIIEYDPTGDPVNVVVDHQQIIESHPTMEQQEKSVIEVLSQNRIHHEQQQQHHDSKGKRLRMENGSEFPSEGDDNGDPRRKSLHGTTPVSIEEQEQSIIEAFQYQQQQNQLRKQLTQQQDVNSHQVSYQRHSPTPPSPSRPISPSQSPTVSGTTDSLNSRTVSCQPQSPAQPQLQQQQHISQAVAYANINQSNFIARLISKDNILLISEELIEIGRNSSRAQVDFHVGRNSFVSRKHLILHHDSSDGEFYISCLSKNGVFVDNLFHRKGSSPFMLPRVCSIRFPSTNIKIQFENLLHRNTDGTRNLLDTMTQPLLATSTNAENGAENASVSTIHLSPNASINNTNSMFAPLKIAIPPEAANTSSMEHMDLGGRSRDNGKSPYPSPTGTISAANSCPTSPRQGYNDFTYAIGNNGPGGGGVESGGIPIASTSAASSSFNEFQPPTTSQSLEGEKPPYSYAQLIVQSISASAEKQLTLSGIYSFISKNYPYYRNGTNKGWQNSIRHNLSLNRYFIKVPRLQDEPGKGSFWRIDPNSELKLVDQSYRKRRQRGTQCFRTPFGLANSAPVSPTPLESESRDGSPLNEMLMQSAPGSPGQVAANAYVNSSSGTSVPGHPGHEEHNNYPPV